jgi:hypothetical protein
MAQREQTFKNHARIVPVFHIFGFLLLLVNVIWALYRFRGGVTGDAIVQLCFAVAVLVMFGSIRAQILTVQDLVIRLEMRLRLARVLPATLQSSILTLTHKQLVALRFASDSELIVLLPQVVSGELKTQKDIKSRVKDWQADYLRA